MVKNDVIKDFYALTRHLLGKSWQERYPDRYITATGLKVIMRRYIEQGDEPECTLIRKFVGISNIVDYFRLEFKSVEDYSHSRGSGLHSSELMAKLPEIIINPADLQGFIRVCNLISNAVKNPSAL